ncbi:MAG: hypothetical protein C0598_12475 [Marinilabiliales bacterium]|nr:MAG: hypothetical protein C0598_12475 [Marinilabiliales bacterium]
MAFSNTYSQEATMTDETSDVSLKTKKFTPGWGIGIKASTFGFGADVIKSFNQNFTLRLGGSYMKQDIKISTFDDLGGSAFNYTTLGSISLIFDYYIFRSVYISAGAMYNMTKLEFESQAEESQTIGNIEISPETIGSVTYTLLPNEICPYLGIGFGHTLSRNKLVAFNFDLGAVYQGSPKVKLDATGMVTPTANPEQQQLLQENVKDWKFYPFMNFQLSFRIF